MGCAQFTVRALTCQFGTLHSILDRLRIKPRFCLLCSKRKPHTSHWKNKHNDSFFTTVLTLSCFKKLLRLTLALKLVIKINNAQQK